MPAPPVLLLLGLAQYANAMKGGIANGSTPLQMTTDTLRYINAQMKALGAKASSPTSSPARREATNAMPSKDELAAVDTICKVARKCKRLELVGQRDAMDCTLDLTFFPDLVELTLKRCRVLAVKLAPNTHIRSVVLEEATVVEPTEGAEFATWRLFEGMESLNKVRCHMCCNNALLPSPVGIAHCSATLEELTMTASLAHPFEFMFTVSPATVGDPWQRLTRVDLSENHLSVVHASVVRLQQLERLSLANNVFESVEGLAPLRECHNLRYVDLSGNRLTSVDPIARVFPILLELNLARNQLTSLDGVQHISLLSRLDVSYNKIAMMYDFETLDENCPNLDSIDIEGNPLCVRFSASQMVDAIRYLFRARSSKFLVNNKARGRSIANEFELKAIQRMIAELMVKPAGLSSPHFFSSTNSAFDSQVSSAPQTPRESTSIPLFLGQYVDPTTLPASTPPVSPNGTPLGPSPKRSPIKKTSSNLSPASRKRTPRKKGSAAPPTAAAMPSFDLGVVEHLSRSASHASLTSPGTPPPQSQREMSISDRSDLPLSPAPLVAPAPSPAAALSPVTPQVPRWEPLDPTALAKQTPLSFRKFIVSDLIAVLSKEVPQKKMNETFPNGLRTSVFQVDGRMQAMWGCERRADCFVGEVWIHDAHDEAPFLKRYDYRHAIRVDSVVDSADARNTTSIIVRERKTDCMEGKNLQFIKRRARVVSIFPGRNEVTKNQTLPAFGQADTDVVPSSANFRSARDGAESPPLPRGTSPDHAEKLLAEMDLGVIRPTAPKLVCAFIVPLSCGPATISALRHRLLQCHDDRVSMYDELEWPASLSAAAYAPSVTRFDVNTRQPLLDAPETNHENVATFITTPHPKLLRHQRIRTPLLVPPEELDLVCYRFLSRNVADERIRGMSYSNAVVLCRDSQLAPRCKHVPVETSAFCVLTSRNLYVFAEANFSSTAPEDVFAPMAMLPLEDLDTITVGFGFQNIVLEFVGGAATVHLLTRDAYTTGQILSHLVPFTFDAGGSSSLVLLGDPYAEDMDELMMETSLHPTTPRGVIPEKIKGYYAMFATNFRLHGGDVKTPQNIYPLRHCDVSMEPVIAIITNYRLYFTSDHQTYSKQGGHSRQASGAGDSLMNTARSMLGGMNSSRSGVFNASSTVRSLASEAKVCRSVRLSAIRCIEFETAVDGPETTFPLQFFIHIDPTTSNDERPSNHSGLEAVVVSLCAATPAALANFVRQLSAEYLAACRNPLPRRPIAPSRINAAAAKSRFESVRCEAIPKNITIAL